MILLLACAGHAPVRTAPDMAAPPSEVAPEPPPPLPPTAWRAGVWPGPAVLARPVEVWSKTLPGPITEPLATDGANVYAVVEGRVYAFAADGTPRWNIRSLASGPVGITDQGPTVGTETGSVVVLDPANGTTLASIVGGGPVRGAPLQLGPSVVWATVHGAVASTGSWANDAALSAAGGVAGADGVVYLATLEGELLAVDATGVRWRSPLPASAAEGPALDADHVYVAVTSTPGHPGGVLAFDRTGAEVWRRQTEFQPAAPLSVGAYVYVPDKDGHVYALARDTGAIVWAAEGFGEFGAQPLVVAGQVYAGNADGNLYRIDSDGGVVWKVALGAAVTGDPVFVGGRIVAGLANGRIVAVAAE